MTDWLRPTDWTNEIQHRDNRPADIPEEPYKMREDGSSSLYDKPKRKAKPQTFKQRILVSMRILASIGIVLAVFLIILAVMIEDSFARALLPIVVLVFFTIVGVMLAQTINEMLGGDAS